MSDAGLGRLVRVQPREVWPNEAAHFTPWLAEADNVALLGEALGLELEVEAVERAVGPFRADILCKDAGTDHWVLIENQLEASDHRHLGQILTYASGLDAFTIVWIATRFTDEHRATLDWLNEITDAAVRFFALEVELWRIGGSVPAPKFNVVCRPNDWTRSVKRGAADVEGQDPEGHKAARMQLWTALNDVLNRSGGPIRGSRKPNTSSSLGYPIGRSEFRLYGLVSRPQDAIRAELYIRGEMAKGHFDQLYADRRHFETTFGSKLIWYRFDDGQHCRIAYERPGASLADEATIREAAEWIAMALNRLHTTFAEAVRRLPASPPREDDGSLPEPSAPPPH